MFTLICDIFIMCFVLFLFVTCFGWNFNAIAAAETFFCYDIEKYIYFFKIRQIIGNKFK